jgi:uncharacterized membrane protein YphA (DoxX/SURF4 family)
MLPGKGYMEKGLQFVGRVIRNKYLLLSIRLILGGIFILAAIGKIPEAAEFVDVVTGFGLLPWRLAEVYGIVLPWGELVTGVCLVLGIFPRLAAGIGILMIASFIVANGTAVYSYEQYTDYCSCFGNGNIGEVASVLVKTKSDALLVDVIMITMSLFILFSGGGSLSFKSLIIPKLKKLTINKRKNVESE